jgi:Domain of unknown function (DUF5916)/Carbohydrate family 9 binding domain-like
LRKSLVILFLLFSIGTFAQNPELFKPDSIKRVIEATHIDEVLKIDGILNEPEWQLAKTTSDFVQVDPNQGDKAHFNTFISILYNNRYLYLGIFAQDSLGRKSIRATDFKRDFDFKQHDLVTIAIDGFNNSRSSMVFVTNPYGVQRDLLAYDDNNFSLEWDGLWQARSSRTDSGWISEIAIPWQTLRYPKRNGSIQTWGFNIYRNRRMTNDISAFSPFPRSVSILRMAYAGLLTNLSPPPPKPNIRIHPYFVTSIKNFHSDESEDNLKELNNKIGGEMKWAINPHSVLDLTFNTDFAQADVDRQVNNLSRFSVFFPERRQFFLENSSLFGVSGSPRGDGTGGLMRIQPFFSRRIGLDDNGNPIPIDAGARYVNYSAKRNYGIIAIRQRELGDSPGSNFLVGRYAENFGKQNRFGGLFVMKNTKEGTHITSMLDGFFRLGQPHSINAMLVNTISGIDGKKGVAGYAQYYYSTNNWKAWWSESIVTENFKPEMGFVSRSNVIGTTPGFIWQYRGDKLLFKRHIRSFEPGLNGEFYNNASSGRLMEKQLNIRPVYFNMQSGAYAGYNLQIIYQRLLSTFEPLGIVIGEGEFNYTRHQILASSDPSKMLNVLIDINWGNYFNGKLQSYDMTVQFVPIPYISLQGRINRNYLEEIGNELLTKNIDLYSIEGRFALNPRIQLVSFYQQNSENTSKNYNIRFSWEYQPLSFIYVVINKQSFNNILQVQQTDDHVIAKINFLKQF